MDGLPEQAYLAALATLPGVGPRRLVALLRTGSAQEIWESLCSRGSLPHAPRELLPLCEHWAAHTCSTDVGALWRDYQSAGVRVVAYDDPEYPSRVRDDHQAPAVMFSVGDVSVASSTKTVAIVGTRRCTPYGRNVASLLAAQLSQRGISIVSGLAAGVDAAAHQGALQGSAPPVAVVGSGIDVVYPRRNKELWAEVATRGVIWSEAPLGARPEAWRFPARNRIIAALADAVVVAESPERGGSFHTVNAAISRGIPVMAVPGPILSGASAGTNRLISEGCAPVCDVDDVVVALGLAARPAAPDAVRRDDAVLQAIEWTPTAADDVIRATSLNPIQLSARLQHLQDEGLIDGDAGYWWRCPKPR